MEENKYYVPEIEEFCVGFEYEVKERIERGINSFNHTVSGINPHFEVKKFSVFDNFNYISLNLKEDVIRVKKLDKEDILESVFILTGKPKNKLYFRTEDDRYGITLRDNFYEDGLNNVHIYEFRVGGVDTLFLGKIKNKTEFKKLLRQLEIWN